MYKWKPHITPFPTLLIWIMSIKLGIICDLVTLFGVLELGHVMACLTAPDHYLNRYQLIVKGALCHSTQSNLTYSVTWVENWQFMIITISPICQRVAYIHDSRAVCHRIPYLCFWFNIQSLLIPRFAVYISTSIKNIKSEGMHKRSSRRPPPDGKVVMLPLIYYMHVCVCVLYQIMRRMPCIKL